MPLTPKKAWTVLIYMVADDPQGGQLLDDRAIAEMDQITKYALADRDKKDGGGTVADAVNVALQVDYRTLPGVWRRVIGRTTFVGPEANAATPETLYGFFDWAARECPADHYLLIFWGHSRGPFGMFGDSDPWDYTAQTLTLKELSDALTAAKRSLGKAVDIIAFKDCFMATLETAYQLAGLADYLLASQALVPVVGWPYAGIFGSLRGKTGLDAADSILSALEAHYGDKKNLGSFPEVPYSLLSTRGAVAVVEQLKVLVGEGRTAGILAGDTRVDDQIADSASKGGDPALVDLGILIPDLLLTLPAASKKQPSKATKKVEATLKAFAGALGKAAPGGAAIAGSSTPKAGGEPLVIRHTGSTGKGGNDAFGGVSIFVYPSSPKAQRESMLTKLANEKVYRSLAISTDTNWADVALQKMPIDRARPADDVAKAIAMFEQLQRIGVGAGSRAASRAADYLLRARNARNPNMSNADIAEAAEYAAIAELASRLAEFAFAKGGDGFAKGGDGFAKGGDGFAKGGDGFAKGGDGFAKGGDGFGS